MTKPDEPAFELKLRPQVYYNHGKNKIIIVVNWRPDEFGGPAIIDSSISLMPGEGIDLNYLGLRPYPVAQLAKGDGG